MHKLAALSVVFAAVFGCAVTKDGKCVDYQPVMGCPLGQYEECITTKDGCEQCSCVAANNRGLPPGIDDRR